MITKPPSLIRVRAIKREVPDLKLLARVLIEIAEEELRQEGLLEKCEKHL